MKILNFWTVALMALSFSTTFVSCGDDNDINLAKEIAGTYNGYSVGVFITIEQPKLIRNIRV